MGAESELRWFTCLTGVALIFSMSTLAVHILGYQYAESSDTDSYPDDEWKIIYGYEDFYVETTVTKAVTRARIEASHTYRYSDVINYFDKMCGTVVDDAFCHDIQKLEDGGKYWLSLNSAGLSVLFIACVFQCFYIMAPNTCCSCTHWIVSTCCCLAAILFWAAFVVWQEAFSSNKATDAIMDFVFSKVIALNPTETWEYQDATIGVSTILLIICSILSLAAMFMTFRFSFDRVSEEANQGQFENIDDQVQSNPV